MPNEGSRREPCRTRVHGWSQVSWFRSTGNSRRFLDASSRQPARRAVPRLVSPSTSRAVPKRSQSHLALSSRALDRNYKTAVPQYWRGRIQLLLPLWAARKVVDVDLGRLGVEEWTTGSIRSRWPARWAPGSSSARSRPRRSRRHGAAVERHRVHVISRRPCCARPRASPRSAPSRGTGRFASRARALPCSPGSTCRPMSPGRRTPFPGVPGSVDSSSALLRSHASR